MKTISKFLIAFLTLLMLPMGASASIFKDVSEKAWYYPYVLDNQKRQIITGYEDGTFRPQETMTRAQAAKIISRIIDVNSVGGTFKPKYKDVSTDHSAYNEIAALTRIGIFQDGDYFYPNNSLTRAQLAKIIVNMYDFKINEKETVSFKDVPKGYWATPYIAFLTKTGISTGTTKNTFEPTKAVTRAQALVLLDKSAQYKENPSAFNGVYDPFTKQYKTIKQANPSFVSETIQLVNKEREKKGLSKLTEDKELNQIAFIKAEDMINEEYFDHYSNTYGQPWDMAQGFGYSYRTFGENIAYGYKSSSSVVTAWMNSPGHKANILNAKYTNIGVGIAKDSDGQYYFVHMFSSK